MYEWFCALTLYKDLYGLVLDLVIAWYGSQVHAISVYSISISCPIQCFPSEPWSPLCRVHHQWSNRKVYPANLPNPCRFDGINIALFAYTTKELFNNALYDRWGTFGWNETWNICIMDQLSFNHNTSDYL